MFRTYKTEGIVIKRVNYGESDKLITIFTNNHGKIVVLAKAVRKINSRKAAHLELFHKILTNLAKGRAFDLVIEAETLISFPVFTSDLIRLAYGYRIIEIIDKLCPEGEEHNNIYNLLLSVLHKLNNRNLSPDISVITTKFIHQLLWELGYLGRGEILQNIDLEKYLEEVIERSLKSTALLTKLKEKV